MVTYAAIFVCGVACYSLNGNAESLEYGHVSATSEPAATADQCHGPIDPRLSYLDSLKLAIGRCFAFPLAAQEDAKCHLRVSQAKTGTVVHIEVVECHGHQDRSAIPVSPAQAYSQEPAPEQRAKDIAQLEGQIEAEIARYNAYPRRYFVGLEPPAEVKAYLAPVFEKIDRIGSLNYPREARGKLYGNVIVEFQIGTAGDLIDVKVVKTSGHEVLDRAALRSVRLATPFSAFTAGVKQRADILVVIRRFTFEHVELPGKNAQFNSIGVRRHSPTQRATSQASDA